MASRTMKNLLRRYLRYAAQSTKTVTTTVHITLITAFLNILSGRHEHACKFWSKQIFFGIRQRFGNCAVSDAERENLLNDSKPMTVYMVHRFIEMLGIEVTRQSLIHLNNASSSFKFLENDILKSGVKIKHNIYVKEFAEAMVLSKRSLEVSSMTYQKRVVSDKPLLYWTISESRDSAIVHNYGTLGEAMIGTYSGREETEQAGPLMHNDAKNNSAYFDSRKSCRISTNFCREVSPTDNSENISLEIWAKVTGEIGTNRTAIMTGRCALVATREEKWVFQIFQDGVTAALEGPFIQYDKFEHVVGSFDGKIATIYLNGCHCAQFFVEREIQKNNQTLLQERINVSKKLDMLEREARTKSLAETEDKCQETLSTKKGKKMMRTMAKTLMAERADQDKNEIANFLPNHKAKEQAMEKAVEQYKCERQADNLKLVISVYQKKRQDILEQQNSDDEYANSILSQPMSVGSTCRSTNFSDGHQFFEGNLSHAAIFNCCLSPDDVNGHWKSARTDEEILESDRLSLLADEKFEKALDISPQNRDMIQKYIVHICNSLERCTNEERINNAVAQLKKLRSTEGLTQLLKVLPFDKKYSHLVYKIYTIITTLDPKFFMTNASYPLNQLAMLPFNYSLTKHQVAMSAGIFREILSKESFENTYGGVDLHWVSQLESDTIVVSLVAETYLKCHCDTINMNMHHDCTSILSDFDLIWISKNCPFLKSLTLTGCINITDVALEHVAGCSLLEFLNISGCTKITGNSLLSLGGFLPRLKQFTARQCSALTDQSLVQITKECSKLTHLDLAESKLVNDSVLKEAGNLEELAYLNVSFCTSLTNMGIYQFAMSENKSKFLALNLTGCRSLTDEGIAALARLRGLQSIILSGLNRCTEKPLKELITNCLELEILDIEDLHLITDECFNFDHNHEHSFILKKLKYLNISDCSNITDIGISSISNRCQNLSQIKSSGLCLITDEAINKFVTNIGEGRIRGGYINSINLDYCLKLTNDTMNSISSHCGMLKQISLKGCVHITDEGVEKLAAGCGRLVSISLSGCKRITNRSIYYLSQIIALEDIDISSCNRVTDQGIEELTRINNQLKAMNISKCRSLTIQSIRSIEIHCAQISVLRSTGLTLDMNLCLKMFGEKNPKCKVISS